MKIGIIIWRMAFSGAENVANALIQQFKKDGHDVHIMLTSTSDMPKGVENVHNLTYGGNKFLRIIRRSIGIRRVANKEKFDVVVGFGHIDSIHMIRALLFSRIPKVACERMDPATYPFKSTQRTERDILYKLLDGIILQTNRQKEFYDAYLNVKSVAIPNPVRAVNYKAVAVNERKKEFVTVARLDNAQKNHLFMFECFMEFDRHNQGYVLKVYGDGPDRSMYASYIKEHHMEGKIILCGKVSEPQKHIREAQIFLLTSNHEGMPNALIEAMALGMPCISTRCGGGGPEDLIVNGKNGYLVDMNDKAGFVRMMESLAQSEELQCEIGSEAEKITEQLSIEKVAAKWIEAFHSFIGDNEKC